MTTVLLPAALLLAAAGFAQTYPAPQGLPAPDPAPQTPGLAYTPPVSQAPPPAAAPVIYSHTADAGPDETAFLTGRGFTSEAFVWGPNLTNPGGGPIPAKTVLSREDSLFLTPAQNQPDGLYLVWLGKQEEWSEPVRLNAPEPWWCGPDKAVPGERTRVFGRDLARRPDRARAFIYLAQAGKQGVWAPVTRPGKYAVEFTLPGDLAAGEYQVWVHAGMGGGYGWGGPVKLTVEPSPPAPSPSGRTVTANDFTREGIGKAMAELGEGGGTVELGPGVYDLDGSLTLPANVTLRGRGVGETVLQLSSAPGLKLARVGAGGWGLAPASIHTVGDTLVYEVTAPEAADYTVWLRYGTDMAPWNIDKMDEHTQLQAGDQAPVPLMNLPNTGGWNPSAWSKAATVHLAAGKQRVTWRNVKGGGLSMDAFVFAKDPTWNPEQASSVAEAPGRIIRQAEDVVEMHAKEGNLPGQTAAVVLLAGDNAGLSDLTILGSDQATVGVYVRSPEHPRYLHGARLEKVRIADLGGSQSENCGVLIEHADHVVITGCDITARAPVFMRGLVQGRIIGNRLCSVTRIGGNAEAALLARNDVLRETIIEDNLLVSPYPAGGPTQRRMIWVSTGAGSVDHNYFARNRSEGQQFGGVAGTDQNVGEMILFEANMRMAYYGAPESADERSVTVPAQGPFLPPTTSENLEEPLASEYYVTIGKGPGLGQTRRVVAREDRRFVLDRPWRVLPTPESLVVITTLFYRNLVCENETLNGMTGIQLWIGCVENVVADNVVAHQRKPGIFLFGCQTLADPAMPRTWNRGIGVFYYNQVEGNRIEETTDGIYLTASVANDVPPIQWPLCLGTVLRQNSCVLSRAHGINVVGNHTARQAGPDEQSILGTIVEFNSVRDQPVAYMANDLTRATVFRRNHAYSWHTWTPETKPTAYSLLGAQDVTLEDNSTEGASGTEDGRIIERETGEGK